MTDTVAGKATTRRELLTGATAAGTDRLRRLLSVEQLLLYVYEQVLGASILPAAARTELSVVRSHEQVHVRTLQARLTQRGGRVPQAPASVADANRRLAVRQVSGRLGQLRGPDDALRLLLALERVVVGAYFVALIKLTEPSLITLASQIMASDSQHQAILGTLLEPRDIPAAVPSGLVQGVQ